MNYSFKAGKQWNAYKCLCGQWWTRSSWFTRTNGIDQRATTCSEQVNKKEQGNKFGKTFMLKVYVYSRTSIRQKLGSEDSSAWLYWSLCRRSHSNNLQNTSCTALASQQIDRCVPVWLGRGCLQKAPDVVGAELQWGLNCRSCMGEGAARRAAPLCVTPHLSPISSASAPPLLFTPAWCKPALRASWDTLDSVPQRKKRRTWWWWLQGQEAPGPEVRRFLLLSSVKGDLKQSDPPRLIPKTYNLHTAWLITFSAIVSTEQMLEKLLGMKNLGISTLPLVGVEMEARSLFFFCSWALKTLSRAVMGGWVLVHRFKRSLPAKKNRNCLLLVTMQGFWAVEQQFCFLKRGKAVMSV